MDDAKKTDDHAPLWEHSEAMLKKAHDFTLDSIKKLSVKDADLAKIGETIKSTVRLMKKNMEVTGQCLKGIEESSDKASVTYICPKCAETRDQSGKCPKCNVVLENQIDYILKTADKLLKEIKAENANALIVTCEQMLKKALAKIKICNGMLAEDKPSTAEIAQSAKDSISLVQKSAEVSEKYLEIKNPKQKPADKTPETEKPKQNPAGEKSGSEKK